ncbi:unnamed protein product [Schistocephalus solidus]|uniref:Peptidase_M14 domain-containing protein n=1 Tax=Schistocephalus solidus TaxID=70667 RepID=A0A183T1U4_SCHSO|nr:unnamed protein product [Schistocephalus solidus]
MNPGNCKQENETRSGCGFGNVSKYAVLTPNDPELKKGHLIFDASFESGNLGRVEALSEFEYDLYIRPDTCNPKTRNWFYFSIENVRPQQVLPKYIDYFYSSILQSVARFIVMECLLLLCQQADHIVIVTLIRCRIPRKNVFYYRSPEHENNYILSFAICFDREDDIYYFCYCYPYTYTQLQRYLKRISQTHSLVVKRELLGMSLGLRRLDLLTITDPQNANLFGLPKKRIVFVTARVHPGETPSSYVCQGLIDFLTSSHVIAKQLRLHLVFMIVPMLNPDGVFFGNYRSSLLGFDLNRHWQEPLPVAQPTIHSVKNLLASLDKFDSTNLDFFVDIHAHSTLTNGFMYGNMHEDEERNERESLLPHLLSRCAEDFSLSQTDFNNHSMKAGTGRRLVALRFA